MPSEWRYNTALGRPWTMSQGPEKLLKTLKKAAKNALSATKARQKWPFGLAKAPNPTRSEKTLNLHPFWGHILVLVEIIFSV